jgi:acyl-CoA thioester hydrolase
VRRVEADYLSSARFDDDLVVRTSVLAMTGVRIILNQDVMRGEEVLFSANVTLVALTLEGQPTRLPANIRRIVH